MTNEPRKQRILRTEPLEDRLVLNAAALTPVFVSADNMLEGETAFIGTPDPTAADQEFYVGTFYDADKSYRDQDSSLCWAASTANVLFYTNWGRSISVSAEDPEETVFTTADDLYKTYVDNFTNEGASLNSALAWFADGTFVSGAGGSELIGDGGAFFPGIDLSKVKITLNSGTAKNTIMSKTAEYLAEGYGISVAVGWFTTTSPTSRNGGHALTLWGYTYNDELDPYDPNYYTGILVTNSDDGLDNLLELPMEWNAKYGMYHITHFWFVKGWIEQVVCLKSVEPLTGVTAVGYDGYYDGAAHSLSVNGLKKTGSDRYTIFYTVNGKTETIPPSFTDPGTYEVRVVVVKNDYEAVWSAPAEINISDGTGRIPAPTLLSAASAGQNTQQIVWSETPGAVNYELIWSSDDGVTWSKMITSDTEAVVGGLAYGETFQYRVRSLGDGADTFTGRWSNTVSALVNPSDLDGDGFIGPGDYALLSTAWFASEGDEDWDPRFDVDGDGFIGPGDFTYLSANWFKTGDSEDFRYPAV